MMAGTSNFILCCFTLATIAAFICRLPPPAKATVLHKLVDVKGNGALREVRIMYDLYQSGTATTNNNLNSPDNNLDGSAAFSAVINTGGGRSQQQQSRYYSDGGKSDSYYQGSSSNRQVNVPIYPWTHHHSHHTAAHAPPMSQNQMQVSASIAESTSNTNGYHPNYYLEQGISRPHMMPNARNKFKNVQPHLLVRGKPLFVEVDFVPNYIPQLTYHVAVSVTLPAHIRGRPWILGYHQEVFPIPSCRLCTNRDQSFTLPVTLFLPDDGWCPEGRVPSIWKIEALPRETSTRLSDQTDMILAYGYDDLRQLFIVNDSNGTAQCRGINEAIIA